MGGSSEPDNSRGFGRIHLEAGMPLAGNGSLVLFVADAATTSIPELTRREYNFTVDGDAGLDLRVTLSWIDRPSTTFSSVQLADDLDLSVVSPSGTRYTMWASGETDAVNVNERVIVDAGDVESGAWSVWVWAKRLGTDAQSYSLVVTGAISAAAAEGAEGEDPASSTTLSSDTDGTPVVPSNETSSSSTSLLEDTDPPIEEPSASTDDGTDSPAEEPGSSSDEATGAPVEGAGTSGGSPAAFPAPSRLGLLWVACAVAAGSVVAAAKSAA